MLSKLFGGRAAMVKCADCGFLAIRNMQTQGFAEATDAVRDGEAIVQAFIEKLREGPALERTYHEGIFCFRRQVNLH
jgi:hypothetical protein